MKTDPQEIGEELELLRDYFNDHEVIVNCQKRNGRVVCGVLSAIHPDHIGIVYDEQSRSERVSRKDIVSFEHNFTRPREFVAA